MKMESEKNSLERVEYDNDKEKTGTEVDSEILLSQMQGELATFENQASIEWNDINNTIGLESEEVEMIAEEIGVKEKLELIVKRAREVLGKAKEKMKQATVIGMSALSLFGAGEVFAGQEETIEIDSDKDKIESVIGKDEYDKKINEIRKSLLDDQYERVYLVMKKGDRFSFVDAAYANGNRSVTINLKKAKECFAADECESVEFVHTHPLAASYGISKSEVDKIKSGENKPAQMPPSATDIQSLIVMDDFFGENAGLVKNKIIDPTGDWEYRLAGNSDFIELLKDGRKCFKSFSADNIKHMLDLSDEENSTLEKAVVNSGDALFNEHPGNIVEVIFSALDKEKDGDSVIKKLVEYLTKVELEWKNKYPQGFADLNEVQMLEADLNGNYYSPKASETLQKELEIFKRNGIEINYNSIEDNQN